MSAQPDMYPERPIEQLPAALTTIQPGGGVVMGLELWWGKVRRWWLKTFRRGYVERMTKLRQGDFNPAPHEVLDPRDLKFYRNQSGWYWKPEDDPFTWRDRIPFARVGLAELLVFSFLTFGPAKLLAAWLLLAPPSTTVAAFGWFVVVALVIVGVLLVWFFRDPSRAIPADPDVIVSPADGKVTKVERLEHDDHIGGPAWEISIFLSVFNVHINRVGEAARVIGMTYTPGKFLDARDLRAALENERLAIRFQQTSGPRRPFIIRQIAGLLARRIVCWVKPGDELKRGEQFGMIKLGSQTQIVIPWESERDVIVKPGDIVAAGCDIIARYRQAAN
ncbi:MAG: phosphatidylserine decarboxylase [Planctomycetaceae bacterium]